MNINLTDENVYDIMSIAYTGIAYWAVLDNRGEEFDTEDYLDECMARILLEDKALGFIDIEEWEDGREEPNWYLTLDGLKEGIKEWKASGYDLYEAVDENGNIDCGRIDDETVDTLIQISMFGDIIFG